MKKVVIFGVAGHTGKYITKKMKEEKDIELSVFVRNLAKFEGMDISGVNVIQGDALNADDVKRAMDGQLLHNVINLKAEDIYSKRIRYFLLFVICLYCKKKP